MQQSQENEEAEETQTWVQKKYHPPKKLGSIRSSRGSLTAPSRARNKKQFEQQQQQQQQQLQQLWLNVDLFCSMLSLNVDVCFQNCPVLDETCKQRMLLIV